MILELASLFGIKSKITTAGGDEQGSTGNSTARGGEPRHSAPPEFVQPLFVDAEMVADLVDHGNRDLARDFGLVVALRQNRQP